MDKRARRTLLIVFAAIPLTWIGLTIHGVQLSGVVWVAELIFLGSAFLQSSPPTRALFIVAPLVLVIGYSIVTLAWTPVFGPGLQETSQLIVPILAYLFVYRIEANLRLLQTLRSIALAELGVAFLLTVLSFGHLLSSNAIAPRPMAISVVLLLVTATLPSVSWKYTLVVGMATLVIIFLSGARTASAVALLILMVTPSLKLPLMGRLAIIAAAIVLVIAFSHTSAFKTRFFYNRSGSLLDALSGSNQLNTAGRSAIWPQLLRECRPVSLTGMGSGSAANQANILSDGVFAQPHDDYIRTYCDVGYVGSVPFWGFFALALVRSLTLATSTDDADLHGGAALVIVALLLFAVTDNPIVYTGGFMVPGMMILGLSDNRRRRDNSTNRARQPYARRQPTEGRRRSP